MNILHCLLRIPILGKPLKRCAIRECRIARHRVRAGFKSTGGDEYAWEFYERVVTLINTYNLTLEEAGITSLEAFTKEANYAFLRYAASVRARHMHVARQRQAIKKNLNQYLPAFAHLHAEEVSKIDDVYEKSYKLRAEVVLKYRLFQTILRTLQPA